MAGFRKDRKDGKNNAAVTTSEYVIFSRIRDFSCFFLEEPCGLSLQLIPRGVPNLLKMLKNAPGAA
jgi:hypothetical protein